ncbi:unnamed protein product [Adineta ricciae]|uniref:C2H2-type domain-containing protein n=1 Tax=Adineta ricciae TaxID=249248 RepID=A0A814B800_ADIRI|nr:unnamed protein product [Adineta ricciae]
MSSSYSKTIILARRVYFERRIDDVYYVGWQENESVCIVLRRLNTNFEVNLAFQIEIWNPLNEYESCLTSNVEYIDYTCPICNKIFYDPLVLEIHVNEEHDQSSVHTTSDSLYAQELARREQMSSQYERYKQDVASAISYEDLPEDDDAQIARLLQDEENAQSFEEFQNRYGGSTRTFSERARWNLDKIFKKNLISQDKYNEYKNKLDEMIANPYERAESRSTGLIPILSRLPLGNLLNRSLCRPGCDHMSSTWLDQGWACGYKNFQMLLSSLRLDPQYSTHLFGQQVANQEIPSVSHLQRLIEQAWAAGFDSAGREQLNKQLVNSTKWIGPTEGMETMPFTRFICNTKYFLLGHSRTIIGYEQFRAGYIRLLIFDPSTPKADINKFCVNPNDKAHIFRRSLQSFQKPVYQILVVRGLLRPDEREAAKQVRSIRVPFPNS